MAGSDETRAEPLVSLEVERKYDVEEDTPVPSLQGLPGAAVVDGPELRVLDALYLDSDDALLARAGVALRRREGGPDAGWHIKGPKLPGGGRREYQWPLGADVSAEVDASTIVEVPQHVAAAVADWAGDALMRPLARIQNSRSVWNVRDAAGRVIVEFVDDNVTATDLRGATGGGGIVRVWREWEAELGPAAPEDDVAREALFAALEQAVVAVGGRASASIAKLARALGA